MVVVEREREAQPLDRLLAVGDEPERPVGMLAGGAALDPVADLEQRRRRRRRGTAASRRPRAVPSARASTGPRGPHDDVDHFGTLKISFGWPRYALPRVGEGMRTTWDAAAASDRVEHYVGDPATAKQELDSLFSRLGDDPRGGTCVEVGCGRAG